MTRHRRSGAGRLLRVVLLALGSSSGIVTLPAVELGPESSRTSTHGTRPDVIFEPAGSDRPSGFVARAAAYSALLSATEVAVVPATATTPVADGAAPGCEAPPPLRWRIVGAAPDAALSGVDRLSGTTHYFRGSDPTCWRPAVSTYARLRAVDIYPGIDLVYYGDGGDLEFDFVIDAGADPAQIELEVLGDHDFEVSDDGDVVLRTRDGAFRLSRPRVYQTIDGELRAIDGRYFAPPRNPRGLRFELAEFDADHPVVIDPVLAYAARVGGSAIDEVRDVAVDRDGNTYATGWTQSTDFSAPEGESPELFGSGGDTDAFVTKLSADGSTVLYTTFLGGTSNDQALGVGVDDEGNVYVAGRTSFTDTGFPVTKGALRSSPADFFVAKLDPEGSLVYSTFFGGLNIGSFGGLAVHGSGDDALVAIAGRTVRGHPTTPNAYRRSLTATVEAFLTILAPGRDAPAEQLVYSTVMGAPSGGLDVAAAPNGTFYLLGGATTPEFPLRHAFDTTFGGNGEAFLAVFDPERSGEDSLLYSTFIGGESTENGTSGDGGVAVAPSGVALVVGTTGSFRFPVTPEGYRVSRESSDAFFVAIDPTRRGRDSLLYGTYFGGTRADSGTDVAAGPPGIAYIAGTTRSSDLPGSDGEAAPKFGEGTSGQSQDAYVAKIDWTRIGEDSLVDAAYVGGVGDEFVAAIAADACEVVYLAGATTSSDLFAPAPGPGERDGFVADIATTIQLPNGVVGQSSSEMLDARIGESPHSWALQSGELPSGLTLAPDGALSGIPAEPVESVFTVEVTDALGETRRKTFRKRIGRTGGLGEILLRKSAPTLVPGRRLPYRILIRNLTDQTFTNVEVVELLEPYFDFIGSVPPPTTLEPKPGHVYWTIPQLDPHELEVITYTVRLPPEFPLGVAVEGTACLTEEDCNKEREECYDFGNEFCDTFSCQGFFTTFNCINCRDEEKNACDDRWLRCINLVREGSSEVLDEGTDGGCATDEQFSSGPFDPNEKNVSAPPFVHAGEMLGYTIHFENIGDAEARDIFLTDVLDADLDLSTVRVARRFGGLEPLAPDTTISIYDDDDERWSVTLDSASRTLSWELLHIDLPPTETDSVYFVVQAPEDLASGTEIRNEATIQFEVFAPITTNETVNTIDESPPIGTMAPLPPTTSTPEFEVAWTGEDPVGEIERFFVFVSTDDGPFSLLVAAAQPGSATFTGEVGSTYGFLCVARDSAGNVELSDDVVETATAIVADGSALFHRGDPDASGTIDISDGIAIFAHLFLGGPVELPCRESADANNDGTIDISDGISVLNYLFLGGDAPSAPGPVASPCGPDPDAPWSPGDLGCGEYPPCG